MPPNPPKLQLPSAAFRQKPRLRADSNTEFGVRIFILSDSNFFQSQKHWKDTHMLCDIIQCKCGDLSGQHDINGHIVNIRLKHRDWIIIQVDHSVYTCIIW